MARYNGREDAELERSFRSVAGKYARKKKKKKNTGVLVGIAVAGVVLLAAIVGIILVLTGRNEGPNEPASVNVTIAGLDISGMSKKEATEAVEKRFGNTYESTTLTLTVGDEAVLLSPELTGAKLDAEDFVNDLFRSDDPSSVRLSDYLNLDRDAIVNALQPVANENSTPLVNGSITVTGTQPELSEKKEDIEHMTLIVTMGTPGVDLSLDSLYEKVMDAYDHCLFDVACSMEVQEPSLPDVDKAKEDYCVEPKDAALDPESFEVNPHSYGYTFDVDAVVAFISNASYGEEKEFTFSYVDPEILTDKAEEILFRDVLGTVTANGGSSPGTRDVNLKKACELLDGIILFPGEEFDYNTALGERTAEKGWKAAPAYVGGQTINQTGGGICQPSSCLYYAALQADLEITLRYNHQYISSYVPPGMDATVSWGGPDFRFKNSTEFPIKIKASASGGTTTLTLLGTDTKDYYVKMEYEYISTKAWETVEKEFPEDNEKGYKDGHVITTPYTGYTIQTYKCKYDKATGNLISRTAWTRDVYDHRDKVVVKIIKDESTEPTTEPTVPSTEPSTEPTTEPTTPTTTPTEPPASTEPEIDPGLGGTGGEVGEG